MRYETRAVLSILAAVAALTAGCKQQSREEPEPAHTAAPSAAPTPPSAATPPPAATDPAPAGSFDIPAPVQPNVPAAAPPAPGGSAAAATKKAAPESLKTCCAALRKEATTAPDKASLYNTAASSCDAIDKLVAAGTTKRSAALTTLRAGLKGQKLPPGCD